MPHNMEALAGANEMCTAHEDWGGQAYIMLQA
jgi:hypothetical protein